MMNPELQTIPEIQPPNLTPWLFLLLMYSIPIIDKHKKHMLLLHEFMSSSPKLVFWTPAELKDMHTISKHIHISMSKLIQDTNDCINK